MAIHEMYGLMAERYESAEVNRKFLYDLVLKLLSGETKPEQVEELPNGGFKVNPLLNEVENEEG